MLSLPKITGNASISQRRTPKLKAATEAISNARLDVRIMKAYVAQGSASK
jgi:hypothetical protein